MNINWQLRQLRLKIVYYGPAMSGKTTNIEQIHKRIDPSNRSNLVSLKTNEDRTLFFDFMQFELGKICGMAPCIQLYTVPGQEYYKASRKLVLRGADGVVFVADSSAARINDNLESWLDMGNALNEMNHPIGKIPLVVQYNKRDLADAVSIQSLHQSLGVGKYPEFEAVAFNGEGVFNTLKSIVNDVIFQVQKELQ
ncbi:MAG: gliding-motility protein MglA [Anaerolineae bacterium]|jgi:signal recognition particle receptor subunit beta|nr:gliding-motility protein MglA [Anaerolineae bacterium]PKO02114.1 MAG: gliding-motility protein MglA [Chloroflexi bacterium HGW-Chloroflexi-5]